MSVRSGKDSFHARLPQPDSRGGRRRRRACRPPRPLLRRGRVSLDVDPAHDGALPAHADPADRRGRSRLLQLPARQGQRQRRVREGVFAPAGRRPRRHGHARPAEAPDLRQDPGGGRRHRPVPGAGQGGVPQRPRRQPDARPASAPSATPTTSTTSASRPRTRTASPRPSTSCRGAGFMRTNGIYRETCTPASFPVDRGDLPPAGSGCGAPYPPPITRMNCKLHLIGHGRTTRSTRRPSSAGLDYCDSDRLHRRALDLPGPQGGQPRAPALRGVARRDTRRTPAGPARPGPSTASTAPARRAAATTTPRTSTRCSSTSSGTYKVCAQTGDCCKVTVER